MMDQPAPAVGAIENDPLARLRISPDDYQALAQQGFVSAEYRERDGRRYGPYFKLRWRLHGLQKVRYLGRDADKAARVSAVVANLQRSVQLAREASRALAEVRQRMRKMRDSLEPHLAEHGLRFHGYVARRQVERPDAG